MKLPAAQLAIVEPAKIRDYLLSSEHPVGRYKASFFTALGYTREDWQRLEAAFLHLAASEEAAPGQASEFGEKYEVRGTIKGPSAGGDRDGLDHLGRRDRSSVRDRLPW
jgi:hypothetical protein